MLKKEQMGLVVEFTTSQIMDLLCIVVFKVRMNSNRLWIDGQAKFLFKFLLKPVGIKYTSSIYVFIRPKKYICGFPVSRPYLAFGRRNPSLLHRHLTEESGGEKKFDFFSKPIRRLEPIERPAEEAIEIPTLNFFIGSCL